MLALDDRGVADQLLQQQDSAFDEALLILGIVVFGVLVDVPEFLRLADALGNLRPALAPQHLELGLQPVKAFLGEVDNLVAFHQVLPFGARRAAPEPPYYTRFPELR